ncbi:hypothetical protein HMPREF3222_03385 [Clostridium perfringens]|uniref:Uncharacterized protein n=1 Tax=Clostridium perfringens TaxID=1502 RepID=A0A133MF88_CLOPF|nr:hypothetical protein HMPREF3222_03385 [Clostridium perfringens]
MSLDILYLNTYHVKVQFRCSFFITRRSYNLNTYHVKVQLCSGSKEI